MKNILIISGHPDLPNSLANKTILDTLKAEFPKAKFHYLGELYPDFKIDVPAEQKLLVSADIIVLQFPIFWYSVPSLLARWIEETLAYNFAYGSKGNKLHGKKLVLSFTSGTPADYYKKGGVHNHTIEEFLINIKQTAKLCGLDLQEYVYTGGMAYVSKEDKAKWQISHNKAIAHAERLKKLLLTLTNK